MHLTNAILKNIKHNIKQIILNQDRNKLVDIFNDLVMTKFLLSAVKDE